MKAIIIVDMQNDFSDYGSLPIKGSIKMARKIFNLINRLDRNEYKIISSQDWHPYNHLSFKIFPIHCLKHSIGSKMIEPLDKLKYDLKIKKGTNKKIENYSCMHNGKRQTKIKKYLNNFKIDSIFILGVASDFCVKESSIDLIKSGFNVTVIQDLILPFEEGYVLELPNLKKITSDKF